MSLDEKVDLFEQWRRVHGPLLGPSAPAERLVLVSVLDVPDNMECSLDGREWGVLRCEARAPGAPGEAPLRRFAARHLDVVGYGFSPYTVFLRASAYDALRK